MGPLRRFWQWLQRLWRREPEALPSGETAALPGSEPGTGALEGEVEAGRLEEGQAYPGAILEDSGAALSPEYRLPSEMEAAETPVEEAPAEDEPGLQERLEELGEDLEDAPQERGGFFERAFVGTPEREIRVEPLPPYASSLEHLQDELRRIDLLVRAQVIRWHDLVAATKPEEQWGMVNVSREEVETYLRSSFASPAPLPPRLEKIVNGYVDAANRAERAIQKRLESTRQPPKAGPVMEGNDEPCFRYI